MQGGESTPRSYRGVLIGLGIAILLVGALALRTLTTTQVVVGATYDAQLTNPDGECMNAWDVERGDHLWNAVEPPPRSWGGSPIDGRLEVAGEETAMFRVDSESIELELLFSGHEPRFRELGCVVAGA